MRITQHRSNLLTACRALPAVGAYTAVLIVAGTLLTPLANAQSSYIASQIERDSSFRPVILEDLNGDGRKDLIEYRYRSGLGRELLVYHQQADGRYAGNPQAIEIKTEIIAVGFADLRPDPGSELVLLANNGVFSLSTAIEGYTNNLKPLFEWKLIANVPDPDRVQFFDGIEDFDNDGFVDILLPGQNTYGLFRGLGDERFELATEFSTINRQLDPSARPLGDGELSANIDINARDGIKLSVTASRPTPFAGFVEAWEPQEDSSGVLLRANNFMPPALTADFNGDGTQDIVFINVGLDIRGQVNLLLQTPAGEFASEPDWQGPIDTRGDIHLADFNGDNLMDITRLTGEGNEYDLYLFANRGGRFDFDRPDQVMRFSGYDVDFRFIALAPDARPTLNVSYYTIPVVEAIRNTSIVRTQLLYAPGSGVEGQPFGRRPSTRLEESFSADNVRGLAEQMSLRHDVDGDGRLDALYITETGALAAKRVGEDLRIAANPFWEYVPTRSIIGFDVEDLNGDSLPDLVLRHSSDLTLLVATP